MLPLRRNADLRQREEDGTAADGHRIWAQAHPMHLKGVDPDQEAPQTGSVVAR